MNGHMCRHQCDLCLMTFADASSLKRHGLVHKEGGDFPCEVCGKVLKKRDSLNDHMRIHTGEKPYQCQYCPYRGKLKKYYTVSTMAYVDARDRGCAKMFRQ